MKSTFLLLVFIIFFNSCSVFSDRQQVLDCFKDVDVASLSNGINNFESLDSSVVVPIPDIVFDRDYLKDYSLLFDSIYIVPLHSTIESLIGRTSKVFIDNDTLYILDAIKSKCVKRFKMTGEYIDQIGNIGNGPGEFTQPTDVFVDKMITIYDQFQQKLIFFDKNGVFLYEKKAPFLFMQFASIDDSTYLFRYTDSHNYHFDDLLDYNLWTSDTSFHIINRGFYRKKDESVALWSWSGMRRYGDNYYINDCISDTIFKLDHDKVLKSVYVLDFGGHHPLEAFSCSQKHKEYAKRSDFYLFPCYDVSENYLFVSLGIKGNGFDIFYSNDTKNVVVCNKLLLSDDGVEFPPILSSACTTIGDTFICLKDCYELLDNPHFADLSKYIGGNFSNIKPDDNPVLVFYKMKQW